MSDIIFSTSDIVLFISETFHTLFAGAWLRSQVCRLEWHSGTVLSCFAFEGMLIAKLVQKLKIIVFVYGKLSLFCKAGALWC